MKITGSHSFFSAFNKWDVEAIEYCEKGLSVAPEHGWLISNLIFGYVLTDQLEKAKKVFLENKTKMLWDKNLKQALLKNFIEFSKYNVKSSAMGQFEEFLHNIQ